MATDCQKEPVNEIQLDQRKFKGISENHKHHQKNAYLNVSFYAAERKQQEMMFKF